MRRHDPAGIYQIKRALDHRQQHRWSRAFLRNGVTESLLDRADRLKIATQCDIMGKTEITDGEVGNMMISPEHFRSLHENDSYEELLAVRDDLLERIRRFEKDGAPAEEMFCSPSPESRYQSYLHFTAEICKLIADRYRDDQFQIFWQGVVELRNKKAEAGNAEGTEGEEDG